MVACQPWHQGSWVVTLTVLLGIVDEITKIEETFFVCLDIFTADQRASLTESN